MCQDVGYDVEFPIEKNVPWSKVLRPKDLKARLSAFYPNMTNKEYRFLISEPNFTVDTLWNLLENNSITNFDPVREAFKVSI